jgi:hypothetical protein
MSVRICRCTAPPRLVRLIDLYKDAHRVSEIELARRIGITRENLRQWILRETQTDHAQVPTEGTALTASSSPSDNPGSRR